LLLDERQIQLSSLFLFISYSAGDEPQGLTHEGKSSTTKLPSACSLSLFLSHGTRVWTQGFTLVALYNLSHVLDLPTLVIFQTGSHVLCLG
jgi:hypothetical protein